MEKLDRHDVGPINGVLNAGYKVGATVPRTEEIGGRRIVVDFAVYGPVAIAGIRGLNDVLEDRSITVLMQRGLDRARINSEVDVRNPHYSALRALAYRLTLTRWPLVRMALDTVRLCQDSFAILSGRPLELYRPLIALATIAKAEGDATFLDDLSALVRDDAEMREDRDPLTDRVFAALDQRLGRASSITVSPGDLAADGASAEQMGRVLRSLRFPARRTSSRVTYTITRAQFDDQARRYGYTSESARVGDESAANNLHAEPTSENA